MRERSVAHERGAGRSLGEGLVQPPQPRWSPAPPRPEGDQ
jgi:hypothetical protein